MADKRKKKGILQFSQFSIIGMMNGIIDLGALNLLIWIWPTQQMDNLFLFNTIAYGLAVLNSYFFNSRLTFRGDVAFNAREKLSFVIQALVSLLISNGVFLLAAYWLAFLPLPSWIEQNASKGMSMAFSATASFFFMKYFVFRGGRSRLFK